MKRKSPVSPLEKHVGYWLRYVSNQVSYAFRARIEENGVTVAEWVASDADAALLESFGVDYFQGFHFGKPVLDPEWAKT